MKKAMKHSQGFSSIAIVLVILIVTAIAFVGYRVLNRRSSTTQSAGSNSTQHELQKTKPNGTPENLENALLQSNEEEDKSSNEQANQLSSEATSTHSQINQIGDAANDQ